MVVTIETTAPKRRSRKTPFWSTLDTLIFLLFSNLCCLGSCAAVATLKQMLANNCYETFDRSVFFDLGPRTNNTQFFIDGKTNPVVKVGRWTLRRFGVQHHRQSVARKGKVGFENRLFLSWLLIDDGVEHRNVLKSIYQHLPPDLSYHQ